MTLAALRRRLRLNMPAMAARLGRVAADRCGAVIGLRAYYMLERGRANDNAAVGRRVRRGLISRGAKE